MWLISSSIGRKFVMAITGICLVLFVTFHVLMNAVALIWPTAYNAVCEFLGANWYALVASAGLAALFIIHIIYACWLTLQNRKARGNDRYAINGKAPHVEWSSKNMLVLGIVVLAFLVVHLVQFWAKMQLQELLHGDLATLPTVAQAPAAPHFGTLFLQAAFSYWWTPVVYIIGFVALWFHMNHGFWSMFHTIGWDNNIWLNRLKTISCWWTSIVVALFIAQAVVFTVQAKNQFFLTDEGLQEQYAEYWAEQAEQVNADFSADIQKAIDAAGEDQIARRNAQILFFVEQAPAYLDRANLIVNAAEKQAPAVSNMAIAQLKQFAQNVEQTIAQAQTMQNTNNQ